MKIKNNHKPRLFKTYILLTRSKKNGLTIVEFSLLLPIFFVIIFGIIEFGVMMYDRAIIINASREAARAAVVYGSNFTKEDGKYSFFYMSKENIESMVKSHCNENLISFKPGVEIIIGTDPPDPENAISGEYLNVKVQYEFNFLVLSKLVNNLKGSPVYLRAETIMRFE